jgi:hypothetical protein
MDQMEVVILYDKWPKLTILVKEPNNQVRTNHAHYDIAASQFEPMVRDALQRVVKGIIDRKIPKGAK